MFASVTHLEKRVPKKNQARYYHLSIRPNLFGEWTLQREWGRIGQGGRIRFDLFFSKLEAEHELNVLKGAKEKRGYGHPSYAIDAYAIDV